MVWVTKSFAMSFSDPPKMFDILEIVRPAMRTMMEMTTRTSTRVKPRRLELSGRRMADRDLDEGMPMSRRSREPKGCRASRQIRPGGMEGQEGFTPLVRPPRRPRVRSFEGGAAIAQ